MRQIERLHAQLALPNDPDIDALDSGVPEVDKFFQDRSNWFRIDKGTSSPPTYQFTTEVGGEVVGYAAVAFRNHDHPTNGTGKRAKYLVVYAVTIHKRFQGQRNPRAPEETFAASLFAIIAVLAAAKSTCVGISLRVRADNPRAMGFYRKIGFELDPEGPVQLDDKAPHCTMRKFLSR